MTELEGAILGVVRGAKGATAYFVRKVFLDSPSEHWSGSAGAVYPAMMRLKKAGFLSQQATGDGRNTRIHVLTPKGHRAHDAWLCDVTRVMGIGIDPFRTRVSFWQELSPKKRRAFFSALIKELQRQRDVIDNLLAASPASHDAPGLELVAALLQSRLAWLRNKTIKRET